MDNDDSLPHLFPRNLPFSHEFPHGKPSHFGISRRCPSSEVCGFRETTWAGRSKSSFSHVFTCFCNCPTSDALQFLRGGTPANLESFERNCSFDISIRVNLGSETIESNQRHGAASGITIHTFGSALQNQRQRRSWINIVNKWRDGRDGRDGGDGRDGRGSPQGCDLYSQCRFRSSRADPTNDSDPTTPIQPAPLVHRASKSARRSAKKVHDSAFGRALRAPSCITSMSWHVSACHHVM